MKKLVTVLSIIILSILLGTAVIATTGITNTEGLNFREQASATSNAITKIPKGSSVEIIATDGDWYKITFNGKTGYVAKQYVDEKTENTTAITNTDTSIDVSKLNTTKTNAKATLYALPLLNSTKIEEVNNGAEVKLISVNGDWAYVQTANNYGWIIGNKLLSTTITLANAPGVETPVQQENTVEEPVSEFVGDDVENPTVDAQPVQNTAVENKVEEKVETEKKVETTNAKLPATMYVNVDAVNIRKSADATSEKVTSVGLNCPVTVTAKEGDWYKVEVSDGKGYIKAEFLSSNKK